MNAINRKKIIAYVNRKYLGLILYTNKFPKKDSIIKLFIEIRFVRNDFINLLRVDRSCMVKMIFLY